MHPMLRPLPLALAVAEKAIREFSNQWLAGLQPQLSLETASDGQIWINSRVAAGDVPTQAPVVLHHADAEKATRPYHPRRKGPSYHRRLLRRAAARSDAATAAQAVQPADEAVHVQPASPPPHAVAKEAPHPTVQPHQQSVLRDELCPDKDYSSAVQVVPPQPPPCAPHLGHVSSQHIPQLDGGPNLQDQDEDQGWACQCCRYQHYFETEDDLKKHHDTLMITYEECNICYPWHVWT